MEILKTQNHIINILYKYKKYITYKINLKIIAEICLTLDTKWCKLTKL